jgi:hypothetical protein
MEAVLAEEVERIAAAVRMEATAEVRQVAQPEVMARMGAAAVGMRRADTAAVAGRMAARAPMARTAAVREEIQRVTAQHRVQGVRIR